MLGVIDLATLRYTEEAGLGVRVWATREYTEEAGLGARDAATREYTEEAGLWGTDLAALENTEEARVARKGHQGPPQGSPRTSLLACACGGSRGKTDVALGSLCVCVCVTPKSFKSCSNCEVQQLRPTAERTNHEFLCSCAPSTGVRNQVEDVIHTTCNKRGWRLCSPIHPFGKAKNPWLSLVSDF